jgi:hypothetical protein
MSVEVVKTSLQVLAVAILGGLATFAFSEIQQSRERWRRQGEESAASSGRDDSCLQQSEGRAPTAKSVHSWW